MLPLGKHIVRGRQELDIPNHEARFLENFACRSLRERLAVFEVPAGTLEGAWFEVLLEGLKCQILAI